MFSRLVFRSCRPGSLALGTAWCGLALACGPTPSERDRELVDNWLLCEECIDRELDSLLSWRRRDRIVPLLDRALAGPSAARTDNMRRQLEDTYDQLERRAANEQRVMPLTRVQYVSHFLGNYRATFQGRAIAALQAIGTPAAQRALANAGDRAQAGGATYRSDVLEQLRDSAPGKWASISAGNLRTCGISTDGRSYCWGRNDLGQLGDGTILQRDRPTLVAGNLPFTSISAGLPGWHTCGIAGQRAYCWGSNVRGELGDGGTSNRLVPTPVAGGLTFVGVAAGGNHACAWTQAGRPYCWGGNNAGQVGNGTIDDRRQPVAVASNLGVSSVGVGAFHTCADSTNRRLFCWGFNNDGQLGIGAIGDRPTPTPTSGAVRARVLSVGAFHGCALLYDPGPFDGIAYCVGSNSDGQLGDGSTTPRSSLVSVSGGNRFIGISAGERHTCAISEGSGVLRCWGDNAFGQLGDSTIVDRSTPVPVSGSLRFRSVSAGSGQTCGITTDGTAYCWGRNNAGQLGDGTLAISRIPKAVLNP